jgi:hypothetical protein
MTKIYWSPVTEPVSNTTLPTTPELQILFSEPENLFKHLQKTRGESAHLRCPAFLDYIKNTYVIKAPIDMNIIIDRKAGRLDITSFSQSLSKFIVNRIDQTGIDSPHLISLPPAYVFYSDEDVHMESFHASMETNNSISNLMAVPGVFNISKWIRLIDFSAEVKDDTKPINIKRDDVLFYVRFLTKNDSKVELKRVPMTEELKIAMQSCVSVKNQIFKTPLKTLYKMSESFISTLSFKKKKKCPFNFKK